ncbi:methyltransferase domain-containing protein [Pseudoalteromonas sp. KAN5]|uniref:methyltransferase domain-containing protein n=1 Tax=Pseudoalteromonas sp. KAN5 TaxID=2916633 RepID=UPI001FCC1D03|nr:methyltransferase domain-containing protein [Pseudoalteromonas sp. KAN5]BDF94350.1 malonyl-[acyl-carrier protein] O-methyltransferase [Pseudoalteromonas sp. KAN5]
MMAVSIPVVVNQQQQKKHTADKFSKAVVAYAEHANVQKRAATALLKKIANVESNHTMGEVCIDIGAGPGVNISQLKQHFAQVYAVDLSFEMLKLANNSTASLCADMDALPLLSNSVDVIFSNFAVQWSSNLAELLQELNRVLKQKGRVYLSCVVDGSLAEIATAFAEVDQQSHVNSFHSVAQLKKYSAKAGFIINSCDQVCYQDAYQSPMAALRSLKAIGATNQLRTQKRQGLLTRHALQQVCAAYPLTDKQAVVSYQVVLMELTKV